MGWWATSFRLSVLARSFIDSTASSIETLSAIGIFTTVSPMFICGPAAVAALAAKAASRRPISILRMAFLRRRGQWARRQPRARARRYYICPPAGPRHPFRVQSGAG